MIKRSSISRATNSYIYENIFEIAGVDKSEKTESTGDTKKVATSTLSTSQSNVDLKSLSLEELHTLLNEVLEQEDYIRAITIRDEINARK